MKFWNPKVIIAGTLTILLLSSLGTVTGGSSLARATSEDEASVSSGGLSAASGSNRFVVWYDNTPGNTDIFFRRSTDNGATWKAVVNLSDNPGASNLPQIAVSASNVFIVWTQINSDNTLGDVFLRKSTDNGATWGSKVKLSVSPYVGTNLEASPRIIVSGSNVYVVWSNDALEVLERRSTDNGATWKSIVNVSNTPDPSFDPRVAASGSNVYVTWTEEDHDGGEVFFRRSTDNGATWKFKVNLSNSCSGCLADSAQIAASGSNVYVAWGHAGDGAGVMLRRSADNGATWKSITDISNTEESADSIHVVALGSNVYVVWSEHKFENQSNDIFFRRSTDNGATWKSVRNLTNDLSQSLSPQIAAAGSNVYVVWVEGGTQADIKLRRSTDNGATWQPTVHMSSNAGISVSPQVAVSGPNVYTVWQDDTPGNDDILSRRSTDGGSTWKFVKNLSSNSGDSFLGQIGV